MKEISIVLGTYNRLDFLKLTLASIRKEVSDLDHEIIIIDGGSTDGTIKWLSKQKDVITIIQHNRGIWIGRPIKRRSWGYFMNLGFKCTQGEYICMLSDDCLVIPGAIKNGKELFDKKIDEGKKIGAMAFYWREWPGEKEYKIGLTLGNKMFVNHGIFLRKALESVRYIDEDSYQFYHADGDLCLKMWQQGYECIESPDSYVEHYSHANKKVRQSNAITHRKDWENYLKRWGEKFSNQEENNTGTWIKKEHKDNLNTAYKFVKADSAGFFMRILKIKIASLLTR
jgi:GT2 family glycosyltransferase